MPIRVLDPELVAQIAAGEVIERPASVVKELVENALDAGASRIEVETEGGGRSRIRVADDGCGIPAAEVALAFARHATSKISAPEDLFRIATLGFRGEALAAIAAVARVTCRTRAVGEELGTYVRIEGGEIREQRPMARPPGTEMIVEDLFFNTPARRKFLKGEGAERRAIDLWISRYALAYPRVAFFLRHDRREALTLPAAREPRHRLAALYGAEVAEALLEVHEADEEMRISGWISPPGMDRPDRQEMAFFVNGRWVQDRMLPAAVLRAYHTLLPAGRFPWSFLWIDLPLDAVDVNVHPAKIEVRFRDPDRVFRLVQRAAHRALRQTAPRVFQSVASPMAPVSMPARPLPPGEPADVLPKPSGEEAGLPPLRVIGQLQATYIVAEGPDGLYLLDQHAAHERVLYEELMARRQEGPLPAQPLLQPVLLEVSPEERSLLEEHQETLRELGLWIEPFGPRAVRVRAIPAVLSAEAIRAVIQDLLFDLHEARRPMKAALEARWIRSICKRAAVKAGQVLGMEQMQHLVRALERCAMPWTCPHGRPTVLRFPLGQLAHQFGREP
ncbi:MAG: DNA mismatch repair endonuclease MutL [Thermoflexus hugenholtzii]|jgi:DNA mismatch repair protein MutL|uniref:DNA mismatch repair endonuclease MutL n=1 Tax=Thermoflexus TaxID=1495649 RepID=UPI001C78AE80|nr:MULTISPECIES: DNA mismatch repair endonuclease MutL [Thermoflexus]QWK09944.1 MAG: DNA mismatch repair endonuclease MutL [Thermoflexus hugenholtzii]